MMLMKSEVYSSYTTTDGDGRFVFTQVPPGDDFTLSVQYFDPDDLPPGASAVAETISVPADTNFEYGDFYLVEDDLIVLLPERESVFTEVPTLLSWEPYPGAAYYHLEFYSYRGTYNDFELDTTETHIQLELALPLQCIYGWDVTAYSSSGIPLANSDQAFTDMSTDFYQMYDGIFQIENDEFHSCTLEVSSPSFGEKITSGRVEFRWEKHPLAVTYRLSIARNYWEPGTLIYHFVPDFFTGDFSIREDGSTVGPSLPAFGKGWYSWVLRAFAEDGGYIADAVGDFSIP
jgi:hypothetical protein